jgi:hypothetical protein
MVQVVVIPEMLGDVFEKLVPVGVLCLVVHPGTMFSQTNLYMAWSMPARPASAHIVTTTLARACPSPK